mgnify:CR=1 FL=1
MNGNLIARGALITTENDVIASSRSTSGSGLIINTGSKQGITTPPGDPAYNTSKAGVKVVTESLQQYALAQGLYFPVDFASRGSSCIGGNIATNAGGNSPPSSSVTFTVLPPPPTVTAPVVGYSSTSTTVAS